MKKPWVWMRVTTGLLAFLVLAHTAAALSHKSRGLTEDLILSSLKKYRFQVMGFDRSHWDFYFGFSLCMSITVSVLAVLCWQLGELSRHSPRQARPLILSLFIGMNAVAVLFWTYFFTAPALTASLAALALGMALMTSR